MTSLYLTFVGVMAFVCMVSIWQAKPRLKLLSFVLFIGLIVAAPLVYFDTLSRPKLLTDETRTDREVRVLAYVSDDGYAVYYWLQLPDVREPRHYFEPWSEEAKKRVEQLQEADGTGMFQWPFEPSLEAERKIYPLPQPKLMPKPSPPPVIEFKA